MSDYSHRPGGALKFKGGAEKKKKKKSKSTTDTDTAATASSSTQNRARDIEERRVRRDSRSASPSRDRERDGRDRHADRHEREARRKGSDAEDEEGKEAGAAKEMPGTRGMTESEKRFLEVQRQRRAERVAKGAHLTHKDRVTEFNTKLDKLTEHNDIPKISWTG